MDNNHINNHICNNNKRIDRNYLGRVENEMLIRNEDNNHFEQHINNNEKTICSKCENKCQNEHGGEVYYLNVEKTANRNRNFRESIWTGRYLQMTLMSIPCAEDIGIELHKDTDQYIRVEHGYALVLTGCDDKNLNNKQKLYTGDAVFIPAGVWHNIVNIGRCELKLSSVYAPPHHPKCTVQENK